MAFLALLIASKITHRVLINSSGQRWYHFSTTALYLACADIRHDWSVIILTFFEKLQWCKLSVISDIWWIIFVSGRMNEWMNQPINQSINQLINQSINQLVKTYFTTNYNLAYSSWKIKISLLNLIILLNLKDC